LRRATRKINLNTATATELDTLPQIGPARAKAIVDARAKGPFKNWYDFVTRKTPNGIEAANVRCAAGRVTKFDTCPWGQLSKRPSQRNPWGPGYNINLQCKEKNGKTPFSAVHDWVIEKVALLLMAVPSGYRCLLPHPTKPDLR
jgi:Helix-hairpin-helix motif